MAKMLGDHRSLTVLSDDVVRVRPVGGLVLDQGHHADGGALIRKKIQKETVIFPHTFQSISNYYLVSPHDLYGRSSLVVGGAALAVEGAGGAALAFIPGEKKYV